MKVVAVPALVLLGSLSVASLLSSSPPLILTPYILNNQTELVRNLSRVNPELFLNVTSHSGYFTVDDKYNSNLFFWFFPVDNKPLNSTPWIIWLQGGPGATSLSGLFLEMGPFKYEHDGLKLRNSSWTKEYSMLFIDNPVGAGYSFTKNNDGYVKTMADVSKHLYKVLQQFVDVFPEIHRAPLYVAGESYAGHYVPALAHTTMRPDLVGLKNATLNLQGLIMGNPVLNKRDEIDLTAVYYEWGLIDPQGVLAVKPLQYQYMKAIKDGDVAKASKSRDDLLDAIEGRAFQKQSYNVLKDEMELSNFESFVTSDPVREALHVGGTTFDYSNELAKDALLNTDFLVSMEPVMEELLERYRVLIYCGQLDMIAPCVPNAELRRRHWHWSGRDKFLAAPRNPWWHNETVAGYVKSGGNLTEVLVRNAGHLVPIDKPFETLELITTFIQNLELPLPVDYKTFPNPTLHYDDVVPKENHTLVISPPGNNQGLVSSIVLNVFFVAVIIIGVIYVIRWKRRQDNYFYTMTDNSSISDGILTMD